jgi:hypothetical protein
MQIMVRTVYLWENTQQGTLGRKINSLFPANTWGSNLGFQPTTKNYNDLNEIVNVYVVYVVVCHCLGFIVSVGRAEMAPNSLYINSGNIQHHTHSI